MQQKHTILTELLDFLAEKFLKQGSSVTYTTMKGRAALLVTSEGADEQSRLFLPIEAVAGRRELFLLKALSAENNLIIPVLIISKVFQ